MAKPVEIDLKRDLPKVLRARKALVERTGDCFYTSPCVVGVMIPWGRRAALDYAPDNVAGVRDSKIGTLIKAGLVSVPADQRRDLATMQNAFDEGRTADLDRMFTKLEAKYLGKVAP